MTKISSSPIFNTYIKQQKVQESSHKKNTAIKKTAMITGLVALALAGIGALVLIKKGSFNQQLQTNKKPMAQKIPQSQENTNVIEISRNCATAEIEEINRIVDETKDKIRNINELFNAVDNLKDKKGYGARIVETKDLKFLREFINDNDSGIVARISIFVDNKLSKVEEVLSNNNANLYKVNNDKLEDIALDINKSNNEIKIAQEFTLDDEKIATYYKDVYYSNPKAKDFTYSRKIVFKD